jgi:hypothetical protein
MAFERTSEEGALPRKGWVSVLVTELVCAVRTLAMLVRNELAMPRTNVGRSVRFSDGSQGVIYRETVMRRRPKVEPVLVAVRFRLRFLGLSRLGHWLFRAESLLNTLLFAAHAGFETKLWLTDLDTGYYRGIYEWDGHDAAVEYAETLRVVLMPWVEEGSFAYQVIENQPRDRYLEGVLDHVPGRPEDRWWSPAPMRPAPFDVDARR